MILISFACISQAEEVLHSIYIEEFEKAKIKLDSFPEKESSIYCELINYYEFNTSGLRKTENCNYGASNDLTEIIELINDANKEFYIYGNTFKAYIKFKEAYQKAKKNNSPFIEKLVLKDLLSLFSHNYGFKGSNSFQPYLDIYKNLIETEFDQSVYWVLKIRLTQRFKPVMEDDILALTKNADRHFKKFPKSKVIGRYYGYKTYNYFNKLKLPDSAVFYSQKAIDLLKNRQGIQNKDRYVSAILSQGRSLIDLNEPDLAISRIRTAPLENIDGFLHDNLLSYSYYFQWLAFEKKQMQDSTDYYKLKFYEHDYSLKLDENTMNTANFDEIYKTKQLKQENKDNVILFFASFIAVLTIAILIQLITKRKQRIAEQEREIEIQKTEALLKDQELTTIDAMIAGQEKERQRLAGDLHDNVGATLAAAKLQFDHLKNNRAKAEITDELFTKTSQLLNDAYDEIRNISHVKNSGVIAKNGLLPAIQKLAKNVSVHGKLRIEVSDFGLENRIENSLEITLFRVIQELVTNIIKHSKASEASISITQHEGIINVIIEDNGIGISEEKRHTKTQGMGLENIEKRIEHIEGTFEIDSSPERGTTIIIDVPAR